MCGLQPVFSSGAGLAVTAVVWPGDEADCWCQSLSLESSLGRTLRSLANEFTFLARGSAMRPGHVEGLKRVLGWDAPKKQTQQKQPLQRKQRQRQEVEPVRIYLSRERCESRVTRTRVCRASAECREPRAETGGRKRRRAWTPDRASMSGRPEVETRTNRRPNRSPLQPPWLQVTAERRDGRGAAPCPRGGKEPLTDPFTTASWLLWRAMVTPRRCPLSKPGQNCAN